MPKQPMTFEERERISESKRTLPMLQSTEKAPEFERKTYHLDPSLIKALALFSLSSKRDKSEIVRAALAAYIPAKYQNMAKDCSED